MQVMTAVDLVPPVIMPVFLSSVVIGIRKGTGRSVPGIRRYKTVHRGTRIPGNASEFAEI